MISALIFWVCMLAMFHSYVLYPFLLLLFSTGKKPNAKIYSPGEAELPHVYVIMSIHNEEKVIFEKLESIFKTTYPAEKLHVFIGSDNSTDRTNEIVESYHSPNAEKTFLSVDIRKGKPNMLNGLVELINKKINSLTNIIFVFTDANVMFTPETLYELVKHFKNENICQVGGNILNKNINKDGISFQEKWYIQFENTLKYLEGLNGGSMIGAFGGCYTIRSEAWVNIPQNFIVDDFFLSLNVLSRGKKAILEKKAVCYEDVSNNAVNEFNRKARIQAGNLQNLSLYRKLLLRFNLVSFCFFSHKVIRWFGPFLLTAMFICNLFLLNQGAFYIFTFVFQLLLFFSPFLDTLFKKAGFHLIPLRFASYFIMMNIALAKGFLMYVKGIETNIWEPTERNI